MLDNIPGELKWFVRALLRRWLVLLVPIVIVTGLVAYDLVTSPPAVSSGFTTVIRYSAAQSPDAIPNRDGDYQDVWLSSELTVRALTEWILTTSFKREVSIRASEQGVEFAPEALPTAADHVRSVGQMFISWPDADELEIIAQAALDVLREDSQTYFPQFGDEPAQVTVLDDIRITPAPPPIVDRFEAVVRVGLGMLVGLALAVLAEWFDPTLRTRDEIEQTGIVVLASVPRE
ncbi:MAG: hypothetical protein AAFR56_14945 [Chloroflexota bacterium]